MRLNIGKVMMVSAATLTLGLSAASAQEAEDMEAMEETGTTGETETMAEGQGNAEIISLPEWHPDITSDEFMTEAKSAEEILEMEVYGPTGEEIGDVENILFGTDGEVLSLIAEVGGIWDIGDTHVNVPWDEVEIDPAAENVVIPVTQETVEEYSLFPDEIVSATEASTELEAVEGDNLGTVDTGPRAWRATELIDDYVRLAGGAGVEMGYVNYGYVDDVIIRDNQVAAVVVRPDVAFGAPGLYAYPYYGYGYGWTPGLAYYDLPYTAEEIADVEPLDEEADLWNDDDMAEADGEIEGVVGEAD